ncbi:MAG: serine hydrolase [Candidatus Neomarinimicrobiota bacterium]
MSKRQCTVLAAFLIIATVSWSASIDTVKTYSTIMERELTAVIVIPEETGPTTGPYPVVYLLHGYGGGPFDWISHADLRTYTDQQQMIIVCPDGDKNSWYLDSPEITGSQYETYVGRELVRWVDDHYPTIAGREGRAITGLSMGGHGAIYLAARQPDTWCAAASMSGAVDLTASTKKYELAEKIGAFEQYPERWHDNSVVNMTGRLAVADLELLIDCGVDDIFIENNRELHRRLSDQNIDHVYVEKPGRHSWDYWVASLPEHLEFFSECFQKQIVADAAPQPEKLVRLMEQAVADSAWPGGVLLALQGDRVVAEIAAGYHTYDQTAPTHMDDIFDLASVTKVVSTTSAAMKLYETGKLDLDGRVVRYLPEFKGSKLIGRCRKSRVTVRHLLTHTAGLPPFRLFYKIDGSVADRVAAVLDTPLERKPGREMVYSDIGMITMGKIVERLSGRSLDQFVATEIFGPLGMTNTGYLPARTELFRIVPTEIDPDGKLVHGYVHDENAHSLGGVAGHAGLFATAGDLGRFSRMLLHRGELDGVRIFQPETVDLFTRRAGVIAGDSRCLGWDSPSGLASGGVYVSDDSFGHTGFTGTSLWIDPVNGIAVILLTNAVHPDRSWKSPKYFDWRQRIHSAVYEELGFTTPNPALELRKRWQADQ